MGYLLDPAGIYRASLAAEVKAAFVLALLSNLLVRGPTANGLPCQSRILQMANASAKCGQEDAGYDLDADYDDSGVYDSVYCWSCALRLVKPMAQVSSVSQTLVPNSHPVLVPNGQPAAAAAASVLYFIFLFQDYVKNTLL